MASAGSTAGRAPWDVGDSEGFALRLAHLAVDGATAAALAAESAEQLAARAAKPGWADYAEAALAAAPEILDELTADGTGPDVFATVVRPLVTPAADRLACRTADVPAAEQAVWRGGAFERRLTEQLVRQAARTLVHELSLARRAGRLAGAGPCERFASFVAATGSRPGLSALFASYPVLARMLAQTALDAADTAVELVTRFQADREDLVTGLLDGHGPGALAGVDLGLGDAHQGNRAVAVLRFAGGDRLVYKPRPLDQHALLDGLVAWLGVKVPGLALRTPRSVRRPGYGWLEFVEHRWCRSVTETDAFYRRQGALLALLYAVDGADLAPPLEQSAPRLPFMARAGADAGRPRPRLRLRLRPRTRASPLLPRRRRLPGILRSLRREGRGAPQPESRRCLRGAARARHTTAHRPLPGAVHGRRGEGLALPTRFGRTLRLRPGEPPVTRVPDLEQATRAALGRPRDRHPPRSQPRPRFAVPLASLRRDSGSPCRMGSPSPYLLGRRTRSRPERTRRPSVMRPHRDAGRRG